VSQPFTGKCTLIDSSTRGEWGGVASAPFEWRNES